MTINDFFIANTVVKQPKWHLYTKTSPDGVHRNKIDRRSWKRIASSFQCMITERIHGNFKETIRKHFEIQNIIKTGLRLNTKMTKVMIASLRVLQSTVKILRWWVASAFQIWLLNIRAPAVKKIPQRFTLGREAKKDIQMLRKIKNI